MSTPLAPDVPSPDTFGPLMKNHDEIVDPESDFDATNWNRARAQLAALSRTAPKASVVVNVAAGVATIAEHVAVWDETGALPTASRSSVGTVVVFWPATVFDLQEPPEQHTVVLKSCQVTGYSAAAASYEAFVDTASRSVVVQCYSAGAPADPIRLHIDVR